MADSARSALEQCLDLLPRILKAYQRRDASTYAAYAALAIHDARLARRAARVVAAEIIPTLSGGERDNLLRRLAIIYAGLGDYTQARLAAERISSWNTRLLATGGILMQRGVELNEKVAVVLDGEAYSSLRPAVPTFWEVGLDPNLM